MSKHQKSKKVKRETLDLETQIKLVEQLSHDEACDKLLREIDRDKRDDWSEVG